MEKKYRDHIFCHIVQPQCLLLFLSLTFCILFIFLNWPLGSSCLLVFSPSKLSFLAHHVLQFFNSKNNLSFSYALSSLLSIVGNRCHGSSRAGPADQSGGGGSVGGGPRQTAAPRRLRVWPSEGDLLFSARGHDPAHPHAQLPAG